MTYITKYLPELEDLKKQIESNPDILRYYGKYMGFNGSSDSIDYLTKKLSENN
jgi:hypothetical protein